MERSTMKARLIHFIKDYLKISVRQFENNCGLGNGFVSKGTKSMREEKLEKIAATYPMLNTDWLKTGYGQMITNGSGGVDLEKGIPFYDVDILSSESGFLLRDNEAEPSFYIKVPTFQNCDYAISAFGSSMIPDIHEGAIVAIKEISVDELLPGEAYLIITREYRTIKYIRTHPVDPDKLRLVPQNTKDYDESVIDKDKIERLFLIKGVITNKVG